MSGARAFVSALALGLVACQGPAPAPGPPPPEARPFVWDHVPHERGVSLACADCHLDGEAYTAARGPELAPEACLRCHAAEPPHAVPPGPWGTPAPR